MRRWHGGVRTWERVWGVSPPRSAATCNDEGVCINWSSAKDRAKRNEFGVGDSVYEADDEKEVRLNEMVMRSR